jgi:hypothetical protein
MTLDGGIASVIVAVITTVGGLIGKHYERKKTKEKISKATSNLLSGLRQALETSTTRPSPHYAIGDAKTVLNIRNNILSTVMAFPNLLSQDFGDLEKALIKGDENAVSDALSVLNDSWPTKEQALQTQLESMLMTLKISRP